MDITNLPFNAFIGIERCEGVKGLLRLPVDKKYENHLATVHASALFSLAEASSGESLLKNLKLKPEAIFAVLRRTEVKFKKPAKGEIISLAQQDDAAWDKLHTDLSSKGRGAISILIDLLDREEKIVVTGTFEWFLSWDETTDH